MKVKDIPILRQRVLDMLPVTQSEVWKKLGINSRDGSEIISIMLGENLIRRTKQDKTFFIERLNGDGNGNLKKKKDFSALLSNGKFSPCCGCCQTKCDATACELLTKWLIE